MPFISNRQFSISAVIDGETFGPWSSCDGFDSESSGTRIFPGDMLPQVALSDQPDLTPGTITKYYDPLKDKVGYWQKSSGQLDAHVTIRPKNPDGTLMDGVDGETYTGLVTGCTRPKPDSTSTDGAQVALIITPYGDIG